MIRKFGDQWLIQNQILQTNITRIVWQTVKRITISIKNCGNYKSNLTQCSKTWLIIASQIQKCEFRASSTLGYWPDHDLKIVTMAILLACKRLALSSLQLTINKKKKHEWTKTNWNNFQLKIYMYYKHVLGRSHWVPAHTPPPPFPIVNW